MGEIAVDAWSDETDDVAGRHQGAYESPAIRLLDALRGGDEAGVLAVCGEATLVSAENMGWSCRGRGEIQQMLAQVRERFPGLTFSPHTRHIGFGLVIDEARVRDEAFEEPEDAEETPDAAEEPASHDPSVHPMWDEPVAEKRSVMAVWRHRADEVLPPIRLDLPVRVTVRHDDLQVHEISLSFPAALLKRALGRHVDPFEMSLSEVQSAFIAPVGAGFTTYQLARPELTLVPPRPADADAADDEAATEPPRRRRRRVLVPLLVVLLALLGGGAWYAAQGRGGQAAPAATGPSPSPAPVVSPSVSPSAQPSSSQAPQVTHQAPSSVPSHKPNITLKSDLAFGFNSAVLSPQAKAAIQRVAGQVRRAGLAGTIYVDGYTDNLGSSAYGMVLSQRRADAVSNYLGSQLVGVSGLSIVSVGHGEADPIASNATAAGRQANRRVTITLPKP